MKVYTMHLLVALLLAVNLVDSMKIVEKSRLKLYKYGIEDLRRDYGGDLPNAVFDIIDGFPIYKITICVDNRTHVELIQLLLTKFLQNDITVTLFNLTTVDVQEKYLDFLSNQVSKYKKIYTIFFGTHKLYEHMLLEIKERNFIRRNVIYIFYWGREPFHRYFVRNVNEVMKVYAITNPRNDTFRLFYNQGTSHRKHHLEMINWWHDGYGLFKHPTLPNGHSVFKNFHGKVFKVPVIHKPPWHFVHYPNNTNAGSCTNGSLEVLGGRDHRILDLLSKKLNFKYKYCDPPERIQGSSVSENGTFNGVLGLIWRREAELFIGDVALTLERSNYVEFSFITLADTGAFVTHAPSKLNEALALLRPFQWQVWPAIGLTFIVVGPVLYAIIALPNAWQPRFKVRSHARLLFDCAWFTTTILLRQTGKQPSSSHKARFFVILLSISATYVINDMYSANLTSLLARPGREKAINNLHQLGKVMETKEYNLYVERHSSSYSLLENGTGIYRRLWDIMTSRQNKFLVESVEQGVKLVRDATNNVVIAGRETLFFDVQRFGPSNFHLSEKLNTAYSAIALQLGCPYIEEINKILMAIFEAGIITKMTENEYEKLGKQKTQTDQAEENVIPPDEKENRRTAKANEDNEKLQPISLKMLQGTFYLLCIGNAFSGLMLMAEISFHKHHTKFKRTEKEHCILLKKIRKFVRRRINRMKNAIENRYRRVMHDAFVSTLEYIE